MEKNIKVENRKMHSAGQGLHWVCMSVCGIARRPVQANEGRNG